MLYYKATAGCGVGMFVGVSARKRAAPVTPSLYHPRGVRLSIPLSPPFPPLRSFLFPSPLFLPTCYHPRWVRLLLLFLSVLIFVLLFSFVGFIYFFPFYSLSWLCLFLLFFCTSPPPLHFLFLPFCFVSSPYFLSSPLPSSILSPISSSPFLPLP